MTSMWQSTYQFSSMFLNDHLQSFWNPQVVAVRIGYAWTTRPRNNCEMMSFGMVASL